LVAIVDRGTVLPGLLLSPDTGAGSVKGSGDQGEEDGGIRCMVETPTKEMKI